MSAHTPGPWTLGDVLRAQIIDADHNSVALCAIRDEDVANARLIAAAPDLLHALKGADEWLSGWASAEPYLSIIRAAIAKATGAT